MLHYFKETYSDRWDKDKVKYGPLANRKKRHKSNFIKAKLKGNSFEGLKLNGFDFSGADLRGVSFQEAELENIHFSNADLRGASFKKAILENIKIDEAKTGVTKSQRVRIFLFSCAISLSSSVATSFSLGLSLISFLLSLGEISYGDEDLSVGTVGLLIAITFPLLFGLATVLSLFIGIGNCFPASFLIATILSFVYIAITPNVEIATLIFMGLASFVVVSIGVFAQSQVTYAVKEISYLNDSQNKGLKLQLILIYAIAFIGTLLGIFAFVAPNYSSWVEQTDILAVLTTYLLVSTLVNCVGHLFGVKAYKEKEKYRSDSGETLYVMSTPEDTKDDPTEGSEESNFEPNTESGNLSENTENSASNHVGKGLENRFKNFVNETVKERNSQKNFKFSIVRFLVDLIFDGLKTNFSDSELTDVTFRDTSLNRANFSPAIVSFMPDINLDLDETTLLEQLKLLRQAILERTPTVFNMSIINHIINSTIRGNSVIGSANVPKQIGISEPSQAGSEPKQDEIRSGDMPSGDINITNTTNMHGDSSVSDNARVGTVEIKIGNNPDDSQRAKDLIEKIQQRLKQFQEEPREEGREKLEFLKRELAKKPSQQESKTIRRYFKGLMLACVTALNLLVPGSAKVTEILTSLATASTESIAIVRSYKDLQQEIRNIQGNPVLFEAITASDDGESRFKAIAEASGQISELYDLIASSQTEISGN